MAFLLLDRRPGLPLQWNAPELDETVVRQILAYFVRGHRTADTLEGIARWRLLEERLRFSVGQTETALKWLVAQGFVVELRPLGLRDSIFQLNPKRLKDAKQFLAVAEKKKLLKVGSKKSH